MVQIGDIFHTPTGVFEIIRKNEARNSYLVVFMNNNGCAGVCEMYKHEIEKNLKYKVTTEV